MNLKHKNKYIIPLILYGVINAFLFFSSYLNIGSLVYFFDLPKILFINIIISIFVALRIKATTLKKVLFVVVASLFNCVIGFLLIFSTMYLPGSKEHNYVMYQICLPAMKKYYGLKENEGFPNSEQFDKHGQQKWWYQHSECEQNVWDGKGPIFSENPPGFVPVKK